MDKLRIAICEDSDQDAERLRSLIERSAAAGTVEIDVSLFESGERFLASHPAGRFDIVFMDIYMGGLTGVDAARVLRESDEDCGVVFTTTSEAHTMEAFSVDAEQYMVKPVDKAKLEKVLKKHLSPADRGKNCPVNVKGQVINILHNHIHYVEVHDHNCLVHTANGIVEASTTMTIDDFVPLLPPPRFMRCHQSYIVNLSYVQSVGRDFIMKNGDVVYIRRGDLPKCKKYERELDKWRLAEAGGN